MINLRPNEFLACCLQWSKLGLRKHRVCISPCCCLNRTQQSRRLNLHWRDASRPRPGPRRPALLAQVSPVNVWLYWVHHITHNTHPTWVSDMGRKPVPGHAFPNQSHKPFPGRSGQSRWRSLPSRPPSLLRSAHTAARRPEHGPLRACSRRSEHDEP